MRVSCDCGSVVSRKNYKYKPTSSFLGDYNNTRIIIILGIHVNKHLFERVYYIFFLSPSSAAKRILLCMRSRGRLVQEMQQSRSCSVELVIETNNIIHLLSCFKKGKMLYL